MNKITATLTLAELDREAPIFTLAELSQITRRSRTRLLADIESGVLVAYQHRVGQGSPYYVLPSEAKAWWLRIQGQNTRVTSPLSPPSPS